MSRYHGIKQFEYGTHIKNVSLITNSIDNMVLLYLRNCHIFILTVILATRKWRNIDKDSDETRKSFNFNTVEAIDH